MRILVVGGTRFVGRHLVDAALAAGHEVTLFHRGRSGPDLFPDVEHRLGDRDVDLGALASGSWDATIDVCGYVPRQIHSLADALDGRGGRYVFVSSVSAYADPAAPGFREDSPLIELADPTLEEVTDESYGGLKVLCERAAVDRFGEEVLTIRPTFVVGPHDGSWRFPWWVARIARGGEVLAPGPRTDPIQVIDARDIASWTIGMIERGATGTFHTVGPAAPITWDDLLSAVRDVVAPPATTLHWIDEEVARAAGLDGNALPLWPATETSPLLNAADPGAAIAAGLRLRPLEETIADTLAWTRGRECRADIGLAPDREAALLARVPAEGRWGEPEGGACDPPSVVGDSTKS